MQTYARWPVEFVEGRGATLTDPRGERYLDLVSGIAVASVGHAHPDVASAIADQARRLVHVSNLYRTRPQTELAERLASLTDGKLSFFCNSGAEAIEASLKLARKWAGARRGRQTFRVIAAEGSFHGRTFGALAATGQPKKREAFEPLPPGFTHVPFGDIAALEAELGSDVAAVLLEPVQGEGGVVVPPENYLTEVRALCDDFDVLLIFDEIQTGIARTGRWFAYEHFGVVPDVMCLAKAIAGGLPMGVCMASPEVAAAFAPGDHASTFGGGPVQSAAALSVLDVIEREGLVERAELGGRRFVEGLAAIAPEGAEVRGLGLLLGVALPTDDARRVAEEAFKRGVLVNDATPNVVRVAPPLVITDEEIDRALAVLGEAFGSAAREGSAT
jgi:acetylornithine aminotransferase/acetylornithine/N-succinyldiaminopimelate aminotransferase